MTFLHALKTGKTSCRDREPWGATLIPSASAALFAKSTRAVGARGQFLPVPPAERLVWNLAPLAARACMRDLLPRRCASTGLPLDLRSGGLRNGRGPAAGDRPPHGQGGTLLSPPASPCRTAGDHSGYGPNCPEDIFRIPSGLPHFLLADLPSLTDTILGTRAVQAGALSPVERSFL